MKNSGLFLNMAKWCFCLFFEVLMVLWFCFRVSGIVATVLKMLVFFSQFFGLLCGGLFLFIWVWKVYVFCGSCFCVSFAQVLFLFVLALVLFCCWIVVGVVIALCLLFCCFFVLFFVLFFVFLFCFCFCFCLEGLRVKRGGPKGHLAWP